MGSDMYVCGFHGEERESRLNKKVEELQSQIAALREEKTMSITLTMKEIIALTHYFEPADEEDSETEVTIKKGDGHSGPGHYAYLTDYSDEGSVFLGNDPHVAPFKEIPRPEGEK